MKTAITDLRGKGSNTYGEEFAARFWTRTRAQGDCLVWTGAINRERGGYGAVSVPGRRMRRTHRVAWELENGPIPSGLLVLHRCDNPPCVNPRHLWLGTYTDNLLDCDAKGRKPIGERCSQAKLTDEQVREIRASTMPSREAALVYGVSKSHIRSIRCGRERRRS